MLRLTTIIFMIACLFLVAGCGKSLQKVEEYIDKNVKAFNTTDENIEKLMKNERLGRLALQEISSKKKRPPKEKAKWEAGVKKQNSGAEKLNDEIKRGRKLELNIVTKGVRELIKAVSGDD